MGRVQEEEGTGQRKEGQVEEKREGGEVEGGDLRDSIAFPSY